MLKKTHKNKNATPFILKYYFYTEILLNCMHYKIACLQHFIKYQIQSITLIFKDCISGQI